MLVVVHCCRLLLVVCGYCWLVLVHVCFVLHVSVVLSCVFNSYCWDDIVFVVRWLLPFHHVFFLVLFFCHLYVCRLLSVVVGWLSVDVTNKNISESHNTYTKNNTTTNTDTTINKHRTRQNKLTNNTDQTTHNSQHTHQTTIN